MSTNNEAKLDEYIAGLQASIEDNEECANHHYNLGVALLAKRDWAAAEASFLECIRNSSHFAEAFIQLGGICMQKGDLDGCLHYNQEAAQCRAKFPVPLANIAFVHLQRGEADEAIASLHKALKWDPDFVQAKCTLASALYMKGELDESLKVSREIIAKQPAFAPAYNNMALVFVEKGDFAKAIEAADKAVEMGFDLNPAFAAELNEHRK